jgi:hypothetical protein
MLLSRSKNTTSDEKTACSKDQRENLHHGSWFLGTGMDLVEYERRCPVHFREFKLTACSDFNTKQTAQSIRAYLINGLKALVNYRIKKFRAKSLRSSLSRCSGIAVHRVG